MINDPVHTRRAHLVWRNPHTGDGEHQYVVGELEQRPHRLGFHYLREDLLAPAIAAGFEGYVGLPLHSTELDFLASKVLIRRLPPIGRSDFPELLRRFGLPTDQSYPDLTLLAYTGAKLSSDGFSICETFDGFEGAFSYVFDVSRTRSFLDFNELVIGETILFENEPTNEVSPNAVRLSREDWEAVGYINQLQAKTVCSWLQNGIVNATVFRVNGRLHYPSLFVRADIETNSRAAAA
ncbi:HIRAN domain-containing protein [Jannaschia marina]|uniref:HIRAN domain-containing protein n=1 Tax=Jannaschia marina TaxID=2741674 RepID=UPI0015C7E7DB|nr:HIRAN domain-containing protein [Jannaschia marina]